MSECTTTEAQEIRAAADELTRRPCDDVERAVANWLGLCADRLNAGEPVDHQDVRAALAVARAINGGPQNLLPEEPPVTSYAVLEPDHGGPRIVYEHLIDGWWTSDRRSPIPLSWAQMHARGKVIALVPDTSGAGKVASLVENVATDETVCHRCHGPNVPWSAPSPLWNQVMRGGCINGVETYDGIVCPTCFAILAREAGVADLWSLAATRVLVPLQTVTPSGRVWNEQNQMWEDPPGSDAHFAIPRCAGECLRENPTDPCSSCETALNEAAGARGEA